jgi:hypothetical protein
MEALETIDKLIAKAEQDKIKIDNLIKAYKTAKVEIEKELKK